MTKRRGRHEQRSPWVTIVAPLVFVAIGVWMFVSPEPPRRRRRWYPDTPTGVRVFAAFCVLFFGLALALGVIDLVKRRRRSASRSSVPR